MNTFVIKLAHKCSIKGGPIVAAVLSCKEMLNILKKWLTRCVDLPSQDSRSTKLSKN